MLPTLSAKHLALSSAILALLAPSLTATQNNNIQCPGVLNNNGDDDSYCCVGGSLTLSVCEGWPSCTGPTTVDTATQTESCITKVPLTQSDYSAVIASYTSGGAGSGGSATAAATSAAATSSSAGAADRIGGAVGAVGGGLLGLAALL